MTVAAGEDRDYRVDWRRPLRLLAAIVAATVVAVAAVALLFGAGRGAALLASALCLPAVIVSVILAIHASATFRIEGEVLTPLVFGWPRRSRAMADLVELRIRLDLYPGTLRFAGGDELKVSGLALGRDGRLERVLAARGVRVDERD